MKAVVPVAVLAMAAVLAPASPRAEELSAWPGLAEASALAEATTVGDDVWREVALPLPALPVTGFGDVSRSPRLEPDAVSAAVRADQDRIAGLAEPDVSLNANAASDPIGSRVGQAFGRFAAFDGDALAYASEDFARGDLATRSIIGQAATLGGSLLAYALPRD
ncbi:hypothetical protein [Hansschlegelia sp. KR7-227]|uniref:hypothetical protein n=1 Tax=Hansschlegelia sp. KR7-227 TaxID=3400914 RepID=UPI003C07F181